MAAKRARRGKKEKKNVKIEKEKLDTLLKELDEFVNSRIKELEAETENICKEIETSYEMALKKIPKECHVMTFSQIDNIQKKTPCKVICSEVNDPVVSASTSGTNTLVSSALSKLKSLHEKRTASASRKKQQISITSIIAGKKNNPSGYALKSNTANIYAAPSSSLTSNHRTLTRLAEQVSSTPPYRKAYATPVIKKKAYGHSIKRQLKSSALPVTPKFDPRTPVPSMLLRRPKVGETIMSLSGSPLQNTVGSDILPKKPGLLLTLSDGKVLNITEHNDLDSLTLDQKTKDTIISVQKKLAGILRT